MGLDATIGAPSGRTLKFAAFFAVASLAAAALAAEEVRITEETPYVQSPDIVVETMLEMAGVRADDFVIDLGSGDGRIVIRAAKERGARGFGVDYDPRLVQLATENARAAGVSDRVIFYQQDIFKTSLESASVITMYLLPEYNLNLRPRLLALKPGTRVVSHDYDMGEWAPDARRTIPVPEKKVDGGKKSTIFFWVVPARVAGKWRSALPAGGRRVEFELEQKYQEISGTATIRGRRFELERPVLRGDFISFRLDDGKRTYSFSGRASAGRMAGKVGLGERAYRWRALRSDSGPRRAPGRAPKPASASGATGRSSL
ncbi:MAG: class I SAM-dependent methyltransferase [Betaproteobacteria bacterium]|nr:class I SAM-dependent methyltransferase [Betaproteobacteria bacterium]